MHRDQGDGSAMFKIEYCIIFLFATYVNIRDNYVFILKGVDVVVG